MKRTLLTLTLTLLLSSSVLASSDTQDPTGTVWGQCAGLHCPAPPADQSGNAIIPTDNYLAGSPNQIYQPPDANLQALNVLQIVLMLF